MLFHFLFINNIPKLSQVHLINVVFLKTWYHFRAQLIRPLLLIHSILNLSYLNFNTHVNYIVVNTYVLHIIRDNIIKIKATEQYVI